MTKSEEQVLLKEAEGFAEACLMSKAWFEGRPADALDEIEHRAKAFLMKYQTAMRP